MRPKFRGLLKQLDQQQSQQLEQQNVEQPSQSENAAKEPEGKAVSKSELEKQYKLLSFLNIMPCTQLQNLGSFIQLITFTQSEDPGDFAEIQKIC